MSEIVTTAKNKASIQATKNPGVSKVPAKKAPIAKEIIKKPAATKAPASRDSARKEAAPKAKPAVEANDTTSKKAKKSSKKAKVIRDSFTMPQSDYAKIAELKQLCLKSGIPVKKSELLRAGLHALGKLTAAQLKTAMNGLDKIKTGRPEQK
jgi:hypothetical protein